MPKIFFLNFIGAIYKKILKEAKYYLKKKYLNLCVVV